MNEAATEQRKPAGRTLRGLYAAHTDKISDKWSLYLDVYDELFAPFRRKPVSLLEIGVQNGGSLEIWQKYFSNARVIVGCDINPECHKLKFRSKKIAVVVGDANTPETQREILAHSSEYDIIVDDGSHRSSDIVRSFARHFRHLADGGIYVVEDLHCSYWERFEGGALRPLLLHVLLQAPCRCSEQPALGRFTRPGGRTRAFREEA